MLAETTVAFYLYALGLVVPPAAVLGGMLLLMVPRRAERKAPERVLRTA